MLAAGRHGTELLHHAQVVADSPAFGDAAMIKPVHESDLPRVIPFGDLHAAERSSGPVALSEVCVPRISSVPVTSSVALLAVRP
jgi:hypothetical protein